MRTDRAAARCENLVKVYRTETSAVRALDSLSTSFSLGVLTAVAGPSGSGKSSLLRLLAGMDRPTSGGLWVEGVAIHSASRSTLRRLRRHAVGYVFQRASDNFFPYMTVGEHLEEAKRLSGAIDGIDSDEALEILGISHRVGHLPRQLSGGEQARAAIAQVLARGSTVVLADEPTAELDTESAQGVLRACSRLVKMGVTFVLATHDAGVLRSADEVIELDHGRLRSQSSSPPARSPGGAWTHLHGGSPAAQTGAHLEVRGVTKSFHRGDELVRAVRDATLSVGAGDVVALLGRSGSGKTTLLNVIAGWEHPDDGAVLANGQSVAESVPPWEQVAVLPQRLGLMEELTIRENIEYPLRLRGELGKKGDVVERLIDLLGLKELQARYPAETSVGEQQRTAFARALVLSPRLLLADEPTGHQNDQWASAMFELMQTASAHGASCLVATHDEAVVQHASRIVTMSDGCLSEQIVG